MPVDEFGREIPGRSQSSHHHHHHQSSGGGGHYNQSSRSGGGGGGTQTTNALDSPLNAPRERSSNTTPSHRSKPGGSSSYHHHGSGRSSSSRPHTSPGSSSHHVKRTHPSYTYVQEPMLCQFLWKQQNAKNTTNADTSAAADGDDNNNENENDEQIQKEYDEYKKTYCLNYIRSFFNKHLDDTWFRRKYSPAVIQKCKQEENVRAAKEAEIFKSSIKDESFLSTIRLSGGVKTDPNSTASTTINIPTGHLFSFQNQPTLHIQEIPPHVTDEQLLLALQDQSELLRNSASNSKKSSSGNANNADKVSLSSLKIIPVTTMPTAGIHAMQREVIVTGPQNVIKEIQNSLSTRKIPRKGIEEEWSELDVECSDHYGRGEYDADGKGGAPADGLAVPVRKSIVLVATLRKQDCNQIKTLSAALSSTSRIESDKDSAINIAKYMDIKKNIPIGSRLEDIILSNTTDWSTSSDILDTAIAYLRRVHLINFYNGCIQADTPADIVLMKNNLASSIHLRLHNADEILAQAKATTTTTNNNNETPTNDNETNTEPTEDAGPKDLLVQRLDDSIARTIEKCKQGMTDEEEEIQQQANEIKKQEEQVQERWLQDHSITDADGRARCSFAFCHKLFKDSTFLFKHLLKKHVEFLHAEQAKCHDEYMMKAWDTASDRHVPDILVECGSKFKTIATRIYGQDPNCIDPEPELWKREEERKQREIEMRNRREEMRNNNNNNQQQQSYDGSNTDNNRQPRRNNTTFVDVDDMKEEKVELSFDNITVPDPNTSITTKNNKKKKKRKLL